MRKILFLFCLCFLFVSCEFLPIIGEILIELNNASNQNTESDYSEDTTDDTTIDHIRKNALEYAQEYCRVDTEYYYGGQDMIRAIRVDCSGMVINCYKYAIKNRFPDITFWLDLTPEEAFRRKMGADNDRFEQSGIEFHNKVYNGYKTLHEKFPDRIKRIDASKTIEEVSAQIETYLNNYFFG